jgi:hypothetical protein
VQGGRHLADEACISFLVIWQVSCSRVQAGKHAGSQIVGDSTTAAPKEGRQLADQPLLLLLAGLARRAAGAGGVSRQHFAVNISWPCGTSNNSPVMEVAVTARTYQDVACNAVHRAYCLRQSIHGIDIGNIITIHTRRSQQPAVALTWQFP